MVSACGVAACGVAACGVVSACGVAGVYQQIRLDIVGINWCL